MTVSANEIHSTIKAHLKSLSVETLRLLDLFKELLPKMSHHQLHGKSISMLHRSIDADTLRYLIQVEIDSRKAGELPYTYGEMYFAVGIPKEFLR